MTRSATASDLARLLEESLAEARTGQGPAPSAEEIENASLLVFRAMTGRSRDYHGLQHLFAVAAGLPPLARLAAIYHDTVYLSVDGGYPPDVGGRIDGVVEHRGTAFFPANPPDGLMEDLATIFGFSPGQELKHGDGLSEYLSAALAMRELSAFLGLKDLWAVAACIEATIPFRAPVQGITPDVLLGRRLACLWRDGTALTEEEIDGIRILAVRMSNADVASFGQPDLGGFLGNTWQLLLETHPEFRNMDDCPIRPYREALAGVEEFLSNLDPHVIFRQHGTTPTDDELRLLTERADHNLRGAAEYLRAHIAAISVLQAFAELTGGDAPISSFTGAQDSEQHLIHDLPHHTGITTEPSPPLDAAVLETLKSGVSGFHPTVSPLAAFFYESFGTAGIAELVRRASKADAGDQDWRNVLAALPPEVVSDLATAISRIAVSRRDGFCEFHRQ